MDDLSSEEDGLELDSPVEHPGTESALPAWPLALQPVQRVKLEKGQTPLHKAVLDEDLNKVKELLTTPAAGGEGTAWINKKAKGGWTALHWATKCQSPEFVQLLLATNADTTLVTKQRTSALHSAACNGTLEIVKILIESAGMPVNAQTKKGWTPLHCAAQRQKIDVVKFLISRDADVFLQTEEGWLAFHAACKVGNQNCCQALLEATDIEGQRQMVVAKTNVGWTPLFYAVNGMKGGHLEIVKWLVEEWKVPVDEPDHEDNMFTALHTASRLGFVPIAEYLIDHGANVNSRTKDGYSPLHWAALYNKEDVTGLLIRNRADLNAQNKDKNTAIHLAKKKGNEIIYQKILREGADLSIRNVDGLTPAEVTSEIPPEIRSRGAAAIHHFRAALRNGKTKPHRMKLMLLGDARVGKTSLYRYLTGQAFIDDLECTEGIDTRLITTPDVYPVSDTVWEVVGAPRSDFHDKIASETVKRMRRDISAVAASHSRPLIEELPGRDAYRGGPATDPTLTAERTRFSQDGLSMMIAPSASAPSAAGNRSEGATSSTPQKKTTISRQHIQQREHQQLKGPEQRPTHYRPQKQVSFSTSVYDPTGVKKDNARKRRKKKVKKPEPLQHDLSELPMKNFQKHWECRSSAQDNEVIKFSVWDFAGQPLYEAMHHTFLTRRALYMIVLNLARLTDMGISEIDLQRIYFWVASVHSHTPLDPEPVRIFFVGTHKNSPRASQQRVDMAMKQLCECFQKSKDFACHIEYVPVDDDDKILAQVENSSPDFKDRDVCVLRSAILKAALVRSYMKEEIPLAWIRYEDEILSYHEQPLVSKTGAQSAVSRFLLTIPEMRKTATKFHVDASEGPFKTMITFFHDVGLVVYPSELQGLDADMKRRLKDVVVPNPQWLVDLMTIIVKIPRPHMQKPAYCADWLTLEREGLLTHRLLHHIMCEHGFTKKDVGTLCILFQALEFICRLLVRPEAHMSATIDLTSQLNTMTIDESQEDCIEQREEQASSEHDDSVYLVPCQLPDENADLQELHKNWNEAFFFDFPGFLPPWLFQHLIVRLVAHMQQQRALIHSIKSRRLPLLSKKTCLMALDPTACFIIELLSTRIVVRHQLSDPVAERKLMKWLFEAVAGIAKQKFKNLAFSCGHLCPYVSCLKRTVKKEGHIDDSQHELRVFDYEQCRALRHLGLPAVECLHKFRRSAAETNKDGCKSSLIRSINALLSIAQNKGHVEERFTYANGDWDDHDVVTCLFSDPSEVAPKLNDGRDNTVQEVLAEIQRVTPTMQGLPVPSQATTSGVARVSSAIVQSEPEVTAEGVSAVTSQQAVVTGKPAEVTDDDFLCGNPTGRVRLKHLGQLAEQLTSNESFRLKFFIVKLDFEREDMEEFLKNSSNVQDQCLDVLMTWDKRAGDQATIGKLREALRQAVPWFFTDYKTVEAHTSADHQRSRALQGSIQACSLPSHVQREEVRTSVTTQTCLDASLQAAAIAFDVHSQQSVASVAEKMASPRLKTSLSTSHPAPTSSYTSNLVLRAVQKDGSSRFYALGQAMDFPHDEIERLTHQKCDFADKLMVIFSVKAGEVGVQTAERLLLEACRKIVPPLSINLQ